MGVSRLGKNGLRVADRTNSYSTLGNDKGMFESLNVIGIKKYECMRVRNVFLFPDDK